MRGLRAAETRPGNRPARQIRVRRRSLVRALVERERPFASLVLASLRGRLEDVRGTGQRTAPPSGTSLRMGKAYVCDHTATSHISIKESVMKVTAVLCTIVGALVVGALVISGPFESAKAEEGDFYFWRLGHMDGPHDASYALGHFPRRQDRRGQHRRGGLPSARGGATSTGPSRPMTACRRCTTNSRSKRTSGSSQPVAVQRAPTRPRT